MTPDEVASAIDCPYCSGIPGVGPNAADFHDTAFNTVLTSGPGAVLTPTIGMLVPGYLLIVTHSHNTSIASLGGPALEKLDKWIIELIQQLTAIYGPYVVFEHGSGGERDSLGSGACIVHGHLHLIPDNGALALAIGRDLSLSRLGSLSDIESYSSTNYALMHDGKGWLVAGSVALPGQWIRRHVARLTGRLAEYDWAAFPGEENLTKTLKQLVPAFTSLADERAENEATAI